MNAHAGALEAVERVLNRGGEPADVLDRVAVVLGERVGRAVRVGEQGFEVDGVHDTELTALIARVDLLASPYFR